MQRLWLEQPSFGVRGAASGGKTLRTRAGQQVEVLFPGFLCRGGGPDFFDALLRVEETILQGDVEIHLRSSDWYLHGHASDARYRHVVLHVSASSDTEDEEVRGWQGRRIPELVLPSPAAGGKFSRESQRSGVGEILELGVQRLWHKAFRLEQTARLEGLSLEEVFYQALMASLGFRQNTRAFLTLARLAPLGLLRRIRASAKNGQAEECFLALWLRQGGLWPSSAALQDDETRRYRESLDRVLRQISLRRTDPVLGPERWNTTGLRPAHFPCRRLAALAALLGPWLADEDDLLGTLRKRFIAPARQNPRPSKADLRPRPPCPPEPQLEGGRSAPAPSARWAVPRKGRRGPAGPCGKQAAGEESLALGDREMAQRLGRCFEISRPEGYWATRANWGRRQWANPVALIGNGHSLVMAANVLLPGLLARARRERAAEEEERLLRMFRELPALPENHMSQLARKHLLSRPLTRRLPSTAAVQFGLVSLWESACGRLK